MLTLRKSQDRGHADHGWLNSRHSFSFADYHDPDHLRWGNLRVINEDVVAPGRGFASHGHRDMEIISYVVSGTLAHRDSLGNGTAIPAGDVQRMSAGRGITHSEFNPSADAPTHFLQIWIEPTARGLDPGYAQKTFSETEKRATLRLIASPDGAEGALTLHADARLYAGLFDRDDRFTLPLDPARKAYVHVVRGRLSVNGQALATGDAAKLADESRLTLSDTEAAEVLVFDLAA